MSSQIHRWTLAAAIVCGLISSWAIPLQAEEPEKPATETRSYVVRVPSSKYWIGIHAMPVSEALKAQLGIPDRLIVHDVLPDSPAAKAGIKPHDILVKFGDQELSKLEDLVKAVDKNGEQEAEVVVLRGGKETTVKLKPADRPKDEVIARVLPKRDAKDLKEWFGNTWKTEDNELIWRALGPGVWSHLAWPGKGTEFPDGVSLTITKEKDQPAKIVAKKEGKTYETTGDRLDVLPDDIRPHVERLLNGSKVMAFGIGPDGKPIGGPEGLRIHKEAIRNFQKATEAMKKHEEELAKKASEKDQKVRSIEIRKLEGGPLEELRKEIEALRKEVRELKETAKPMKAAPSN